MRGKLHLRIDKLTKCGHPITWLNSTTIKSTVTCKLCLRPERTPIRNCNECSTKTKYMTTEEKKTTFLHLLYSLFPKEKQSNESREIANNLLRMYEKELIEAEQRDMNEMSDTEMQDDVQQTYDTIKERIKKFLIHKVNTMKWFDVEVMDKTTDAVIVDDLIKIIKSY